MTLRMIGQIKNRWLPGVTPLLACILVLALGLRADNKSADQELFNQGKISIFDRNWDAARASFLRLIQEYPKSTAVAQAYYYIARCFQFQGKEGEALRAYETYLIKYPNDPFLSIEAKKAVVELAASLLGKGDRSYRDRLVTALSNSQKEVRYFAAIRCSRLDDASLTSLAIPVLREIVKSETEPELADRAKIALLKLEPKALVQQPPGKIAVEKAPGKPGKPSNTKMFHLVVRKAGQVQPAVELSLPVSLAQLAVSALDESAKNELRKKGIDVNNIWEDLQRLGPTEILTLRDGDNLIKIWIQ